MSKSILVYVVALSCTLFVSCKPTVTVPEAEKGELNTDKVIVIGSTFSAGFADAALYNEAQATNYTSLVTEQFGIFSAQKLAFPWVDAASVGMGFTNNSRRILGMRTDCLGATSLGPVSLSPTGDASVFTAFNGAVHNFLVPDMRAIDALSTSFASNSPFYNRFSNGSSVLTQALAATPSFAIVSLGESELMRYAMSGGTQTNFTPTIGVPGIGFDGTLQEIVSKLKTAGAQGVLTTLPNIEDMPFFTTIPYNGLTLDAEQADQLNTVLGPIGMSFKVGANAFVIEDPNAGQFGVRQIQEGERILLNIPLDSVRCHKWGSLVAIPNRYVLTLEEQATLLAQQSAYNAVIRQVAQQHGWALAEMDKLYTKVTAGFVYNGMNISGRFVSGNFYSLDGYTATPLGNALLANTVIRAINERYKSKLPEVNALKYRANLFP